MNTYPHTVDANGLTRGDVFIGRSKAGPHEMRFNEIKRGGQKLIITDLVTGQTGEMPVDFTRSFEVIRNDPLLTDLGTFEPGELVLVMINQKAECWRFVSQETTGKYKWVHCTNPVTNTRMKFDPSFQMLKLSRYL